jgi:1,4-alpha-glucan branching enzyme
LRYRASANGHDWLVGDPYSFGPVLGPIDDFLIGQGSHLRLFDKLGAHLIEHEGAEGVHFAVWAPMPEPWRWWAISTIGTARAM